ncbi:MAG: endonuclease/exonuclease/phosphatase family protein, partial [Bacteroidales bacterium]|nr:endonuclease/exonuclease/phosphatase family protein [Bacteroidales bacterium]
MKKILLLALLPLLLFSCKNGGKASVEPLPVMSFNVRYGTAEDGDHVWENRRDAACAMILDQRPAVFGVQEALDFQLDYFVEHCPGYKCVGVGREDGIHDGEHMSVFYDTERIELKEWGTYWLSETPFQPSLGWDAACRRTATWTLLYDKAADQHFYFVNTHLDHVGKEARRKGLLLLVERIGMMNPEGYPMILTGDMNVYPDDPCLNELRTLMQDARQTAPVTDNDVTWHDWGKVSGTPPIDYVFYSGFDGCDKFEVIRQEYSGVPYVSDHYPVKATLRYGSTPLTNRGSTPLTNRGSTPTARPLSGAEGQSGAEGPKYVVNVEAHRGGMGLYPEETLPAMLNSVKLGVN